MVNVRPVLLLGFYSNFHLIPLVHPGNGHNLLGDGGGEQAQVFAVLHLFDDPGHVLEKAHVQHSVRFIQHHGLDFIQTNGLPVVMVHEPPGCGHHDLGLLFQCLDLAADTGPAVKHRHPDILIIGQQAPEFLTDLNGQFPGRCQNQALHLRTIRVHMLDHGDAESEGFTGAGGCLGNHVFPLQKAGNGLGLDGGGIAVALFFQSFQHGLGQAQAFKCNVAFFHKYPFPFLVLSICFILAFFPEFCNRLLPIEQEFFIAILGKYDRMGKPCGKEQQNAKY